MIMVDMLIDSVIGNEIFSFINSYFGIIRSSLKKMFQKLFLDVLDF